MAFSLTVQKREITRADDVRTGGFVPGVIYGPGRETVSIQVDSIALKKLYHDAGESSLIDFTIEGENAPVKVLIQDIQFEPVKGKMIHADFRQIDMNKEMHATTKLEYIGESSAVKELGGTLMHNREELEIKCLPKDLVSAIQVDISTIKTFEDVIHVKDLQLPAGVTIVEDADLMIAKVTPPLSEEELKAMEEASTGSIEDIEVEEKGKKEEEGEGAVEGEEKPEAKKE